MGQYYKVIFLNDKNEIFTFLDIYFPWGLKLLEHAYLNNPLLLKIEYLLSPQGKYYKSKIVWAGDYADMEQEEEKNLYTLAKSEEEYKHENDLINNNVEDYCLHRDDYKFIVNHSKKEFVNMKVVSDGDFHPLPFLVAEGNGRGGGDYYGKNKELVGVWARDIISIEKNIPGDYVEKYTQTLFMENFY